MAARNASYSNDDDDEALIPKNISNLAIPKLTHKAYLNADYRHNHEHCADNIVPNSDESTNNSAILSPIAALPNAHSTPRLRDDHETTEKSALPKTSTATATDKTKKKMKVKKSYTAEGKIDVTSKREGRACSDAFYVRKKNTIQKAQQLHNITGAAVSITIKPLTDRGQPKTWKSPNYDAFVPRKTMKGGARNVSINDEDEDGGSKNEQETVAYNLHTTKNTFETLKKKLGGKKQGECSSRAASSKPEKYDENECNVCQATHGSAKDQQKNSMWVGCAVKNCKFWVHCKCAHIHYANTDFGKKHLDAWASLHFFCPKHIPAQSSESDDSDGDGSEIQFKRQKGYLKGAITKAKKGQSAGKK